MTAAPPEFDSAEFRSVMGLFATGVTVVTGVGPDGAPIGMAANSFTSVSLHPPLVLVCMARSSSTWPAIRASGAYCVNVLAEDGEELSRRFGARGAERFAGSAWTPGPTGSPVLDGAIAWADCRIEAEHDAGDHSIVVGLVVALGRGPDGRPLLFWRGRYGRLGE